jgi:predicted hotdog family 3-hydroxylacyl-ACP dehydratase
MCLLESVLTWDEESVRCQTTTHRNTNNPLRSRDQLAVVHALEYGAQAVAIHGGLLAREKGLRIPPGYLAAIRNAEFKVQRLDEIESDLIIEAKQLAADGGNLIYHFSIEAEGDIIVSARATIITQPNA